MKIVHDSLDRQVIADFLDSHLAEMKSVSPPESTHALDLESLRKPEIAFWSVWHDKTLIGCGALKEIAQSHGEIKSMHVLSAWRGKGVAANLVQHILTVASKRRYTRLYLETGSMPYFEPARRLYEKFGFTYCAPFGDYREDPHSVFMTKILPTLMDRNG